jgi:hypothetical protein
MTLRECGADRDWLHGFGNGRGFAGKRGFSCPEVIRFNNPRIRGHAIAGGKHDYVPGDKFRGKNLKLVAVAEYARARGKQGTERFERAACAVLLEEPNDCIYAHCGENHERVNALAQHQTHASRSHQEVNKRARELRQKNLKTPDALWLG